MQWLPSLPCCLASNAMHAGECKSATDVHNINIRVALSGVIAWRRAVLANTAVLTTVHEPAWQPSPGSFFTSSDVIPQLQDTRTDWHSSVDKTFQFPTRPLHKMMQQFTSWTIEFRNPQAIYTIGIFFIMILQQATLNAASLSKTLRSNQLASYDMLRIIAHELKCESKPMKCCLITPVPSHHIKDGLCLWWFSLATAHSQHNVSPPSGWTCMVWPTWFWFHSG